MSDFIRAYPGVFIFIVGTVLLPVSLALKDWEDRRYYEKKNRK